jgi:hypothetical protein
MTSTRWAAVDLSVQNAAQNMCGTEGRIAGYMVVRVRAFTVVDTRSGRRRTQHVIAVQTPS